VDTAVLDTPSYRLIAAGSGTRMARAAASAGKPTVRWLTACAPQQRVSTLRGVPLAYLHCRGMAGRDLVGTAARLGSQPIRRTPKALLTGSVRPDNPTAGEGEAPHLHLHRMGQVLTASGVIGASPSPTGIFAASAPPTAARSATLLPTLTPWRSCPPTLPGKDDDLAREWHATGSNN